LGGWFSQATYGRPSGLPWAVGIDPAYRLAGYENFATFEPVFGYEMLWCVAAGFIVMWTARRFALIGERAFALQLALTFSGLCAAESLLISPAPQLAGLRVDQWAEVVTIVGAIAYLYRTRHRHGPDVIAAPPVPAGAGPRATTAHS
jgi:prolipoprotein diacylglyceryltransferase